MCPWKRVKSISRRIKCLTVTDDFIRECVDITADFGIGGECVTRLLDRAATFRGYPQAVRTDNGLEFTCRSFMTWAQKHGIKHILIEPGSPTQNAAWVFANSRAQWAFLSRTRPSA